MEELDSFVLIHGIQALRWLREDGPFELSLHEEEEATVVLSAWMQDGRLEVRLVIDRQTWLPVGMVSGSIQWRFDS